LAGPDVQKPAHAFFFPCASKRAIIFDMTQTAVSSVATPGIASGVRHLLPGIAFAAGIAFIASLAERFFTVVIYLVMGIDYKPPAIIIALLLGIALHPLAAREVFQPGLGWCIKRLLRVAIALMGLRIALGDILALGLSTAVLVVVAMALTLTAGVVLARWLRLGDGYGALAGAATAVCGASATLATATVIPDYPQKGADVAFTVVAANVGSTLVMVAYPPLCHLLGFDAQSTGVMLGSAIHDMAQVAGAGYAVSDQVGGIAIIVKLFRVFFLLPVVLMIGWWFVRRGKAASVARVPVPIFALVFLVLCLFNSLALLVPGFVHFYAPVKAVFVQASAWGLLVAIAALGLGTSLKQLLAIGWRHIAVFAGTTLMILLVVISGLFLANGHY
jgi:uncharacterized integral membrane protein (TIGR00698 family)